MAWETRRGRPYYYRSRREGERVVKEYLGGGPVAEAKATLEQIDRERRQEAREQGQADREGLDALDQEIAALYEDVETALRATLAACGYHRHQRGEWRKRREQKDEEGAARNGAAGTGTDDAAGAGLDAPQAGAERR